MTLPRRSCNKSCLKSKVWARCRLAEALCRQCVSISTLTRWHRLVSRLKLFESPSLRQTLPDPKVRLKTICTAGRLWPTISSGKRQITDHSSSLGATVRRCACQRWRASKTRLRIRSTLAISITNKPFWYQCEVRLKPTSSRRWIRFGQIYRCCERCCPQM